MLDNQGAAHPVRVALLLDTHTLPRWVATIVTEMQASDAVELVGVVYNNTSATTADRPRSFVGRLRNAWRHLDDVLLQRYLRFDAVRYPAVGPDPFGLVDVASTLSSVPVVYANCRRTAFSDYFDEPALAHLRDLKCDVAVRFGFRILRGAVLTVPRYGVWSFHHGDNSVNRGGPAAFWEVLLGWSATGAVLQRLSEDLDGGATLARTWTATRQISVHQNRVTLFRAAAPLLMRKLRDLYRRGEAALLPRADDVPFVPYSGRLFVTPTPRELIRRLGGVFWRLVKRRWHWSVWREQWQVAVAVDRKRGDSNDVPQSTAFRAKALVPPPDRFWADPVPVVYDGRTFIFLEELLFAEGVGRIAVVELGPDGPLSAPQMALSRPYHLSYPTIFAHEGQWYMMPEMAAHGVQEVYRAVAFPLQWELDRVLTLPEPVCDPTLLHHDGRWWLFAATRPSPESDFIELSLFYGDSPLGPWQPHPLNPVLSDARSARPAGKLFRVGATLIRPAQDCTPVYGSAIVCKRVRVLTVDDYHEETIGRFDPLWRDDLVGTHTINAAGAVTTFDVRVKRRR